MSEISELVRQLRDRARFWNGFAWDADPLLSRSADALERCSEQIRDAEQDARIAREDWAEADARAADAETRLAKAAWQSIETAPRDETDVIVSVDGVSGEAYFNVGDGNWWWANTSPHDFDPSHAIYPSYWMPIPTGIDPVSAERKP